MEDEGMIVYIKPGCPWCVEAEDYLQSHGYKYERVDVLTDRAAYAHMMKISGQSYCPTMTVAGKMLADFGADELDEFLKENNIRP